MRFALERLRGFAGVMVRGGGRTAFVLSVVRAAFEIYD